MKMFVIGAVFVMCSPLVVVSLSGMAAMRQNMAADMATIAETAPDERREAMAFAALRGGLCGDMGHNYTLDLPGKRYNYSGMLAA